MVAPTCDLMSSPTIGRPFSSKRRRQYGSRAMKTGMQLTNAQPAESTCSTYHLVASSRAHGEVADDDVGAGLLEDADDVGRLARRLLDHLAQVLADAVVRHAAMDRHVELRHLGELHGVVLAAEDRLAEVAADLVGVDVEGGR